MRLHPSSPTADASPFAEEAAPIAPSERSSLRRKLLWAGGIAALLLLLVLAPPLINANRYRIKIADSMSASLGRPVHLDDVHFHILPVPGFTLSNLVVSEDPDFGAEPTIRANSVEATLRVSSLWHRPVEFSTVRFVNPSVNLVRNADGRWNLSEVLLHASHVESAPTGQKHAGAAPRFPYIEATAGRVNVKLGAEKLPFSLNEADFALWLPSPQQWRVRLIGHPTRTDTNITDPGTVRLEGALRRADVAQAVPISFSASWHDAPLGEASRILTGDDMGWRGSVNVDTTLSGTLGDAQLAGKLTLGGLRRAEFFPTHPLDLQITCASGAELRAAVLVDLQCALPAGAPEPLTLTAGRLSLQQPGQGALTVQGTAIPARWALLWASLFSARVPTDLQPTGTVDVHLVHGISVPLPAPIQRGRHAGAKTAAVSRSSAPGNIGWSGQIDMMLPAAGDKSPATTLTAEEATNHLVWQISPASSGGWPVLTLPPTEVRLGPNALVTLNAAVQNTGYTLAVSGNAPAAALLLPARYLPQLGDGLEHVLPFPPTSIDPLRVTFTCAKGWTTAQICTGPSSGGADRVPAMVFPSPVARRPTLLTPRNLSPLEQSPFSTPVPPATTLPPR